MNRHKVWFAASGLAFVLILTSLAQSVEIPPLRGRVNDYAQLLPPELARAIENQLTRFESETGHQVAVLTVPTLDGEDIEGFSIRVAERWKIGQKGFDNGVILIVASKDRKLRLEVGYGLEGVLPDAIASRIIREIVVPRFRDNDFSGGIASGVDAVLKIIRGEPLPESAPKARRDESRGSTWLFLAPLLFIAMAAGAFFPRRRRSGTWMTHGRNHSPFGWGGRIGSGGGGFGGGGFSGGGGGFGGGGASGSW